MLTGYLAPKDFLDELIEEIGTYHKIYGRLVLVKGKPVKPVWAENIWFDVKEVEINSIGEGAKKLKEIQRNWVGYSYQFHRRMELLKEKLPYISGKKIKFPGEMPKGKLGAYSLIENNKLIYAAETSSLFPNGEVNFEEDKDGPPNRAYLKLWEALLRTGNPIKPGEVCMDLGSSPGGWSFVLASLGAKVISVDKAPLDSKIAAMKNIEFIKESAFALEPKNFKQVDWLFSDIACYPERLYTLVKKWQEQGNVKNFICTIKLQGKTDYSVIEKFKEMGEVLHLYNNKHELTWIRLESSRLS